MTEACDNHDGLPDKGLLATQLLDDLAAGRRIALPTVVVVAHPDDETLGMAGRLPAFKHLTIVQLTDGAPRDCGDANRLGFLNWQTYSAEREREASRALSALGLTCRRVCLGIADQETILRVQELVPLIERDLSGAKLVFTHPYEGGHPDHDTAALAVQMACDRMDTADGVSPVRFEFTSYHHRDGKLVTGRFWPDPGCPEVVVQLDDQAEALKRRALAEYRTQAGVIAWFGTGIERYRPAPRYDFSRPPPPGSARYDFFGWPITAARWLASARAALLSLGETRP